MAFPTYGKLLVNGFSERPESPVLRTQFEDGPPKESIVRSRVMIPRDIVMEYTLDEYNNWKTWFYAEAKGGLFFDWFDPLDGTTKQVRIIRSEWRAQPVSAGAGAEPNVRVSMQFEGWGS